jgi:hypothetical protein
MKDSKIFTVEEISQLLSKNMTAKVELPMEWELSLPMPTLHLFKPAYAWFACPAQRQPGKPLRVSPPDRWLALEATTGRLLAYGAWEFSSKTGKENWQPVELPIGTLTRETAMARFQTVLEKLNLSVVAFFGSQPPPPLALALIMDYLDARILPWYQFIAPDFWTWLKSGQ